MAEPRWRPCEHSPQTPDPALHLNPLTVNGGEARFRSYALLPAAPGARGSAQVRCTGDQLRGRPGNSRDMQVLGPPWPPGDSGTHRDPRATERGEDELQNPSGPLSWRQSPASAATSPAGRATAGAVCPGGQHPGPGSQQETLTFRKVLQPERRDRRSP